MSTSWTKEQQMAIDLRNRNILVSAAAGSGKTAVLVERIKQRVLDEKSPVDIDHMLVVTFTNAAAAQMKERVARALEAEWMEHPTNMRLQQQSALVQNAQITTIDSFCLYIIRNHFHEIDLEPNFRIADEGELKLLREDVLAKLMECCYEQQDFGFLKLVDCFGTSRNDAPVKEMILQLYQYAQSYPWPKQWLSDMQKIYSVNDASDGEELTCMKEAFALIRSNLESLAERAREYLNVCRDWDGPYMYERACEQDVEMLEKLLECNSYTLCAGLARTVRFATLGRVKDFSGSTQKQDFVKTARKQVKDLFAKLSDIYFAPSKEEMIAQMTRMQPVVDALVSMTERFMDAFAACKREKNLVDFGDLEHFALQILLDEQTGKPTTTALELRKNFEEIMIDEYQDSNYVQELILRTISREEEGEPNLFMVGDVKQSIYRFRMARPELFMEKYDTYSFSDSDRQRVDLRKNFRSRAEVLDFTNDIFKRIMRRDLGGVEYDENAALYCGASYENEKAGQEDNPFVSELLLAEEDSILFEIENISRQELEAKMVSARIHRLMQNGQVTDEESGALRPVRYGDIVILLRSLGSWADTFANVLRANGIPAHTVSKTGYFSALEIQTVLNYLRILDNPKQDIPLTAVLKSPIVGLTDVQLAQIRLLDENAPFYGCVEQALQNGMEDEATAQKLKQFADRYSKLRAMVPELMIHELLYEILEETGYGDYAAAMPAGRQRKANLNMLMEKAIAYEKTSYRGLFHFIRYIDELQKYEVDFGEADLVGENEEAVHIMSIHKSKGLEFPVCFVCGLGRLFNKQDSKNRLILHPTLGIGIDEVDEERRLKIPSFYKKIIAQQTEYENLGEELRVLYVALTRAKEKLILTGTCKHAIQTIEQTDEIYDMGRKLSFVDRSTARTYLDLILPAIIAQKKRYTIKVVTPDMLLDEEIERQTEQTLLLGERVQKAYENTFTDYDMLDQRLSSGYAHAASVDMVTKYSVSELKHRAMREKEAAEELDVTPVFMQEVVTPYVPGFMEGKVEENRGALRGTAVHRLLECYDFTQIPENSSEIEENVKQQLTELIREGKVTESMKELIRIPMITEFLQSDLAHRMKRAAETGNLFREKPFVMGENEEEMVLIQGIMDVFWLEEDGIVLLDYKTDRVDKEEQLRNMYKEQLELYAKALQRIFKLPVKEKYLYSFRLRKEIQV